MLRLLAIVFTLIVVTTASATAATPRASLKVTYWPHGRASAATIWTLGCKPVRGTHPTRRAACAALTKHSVDLGPATRACTLMPTATSAQARIVGTFGGRRVDRSYRIGCPGWNDLRIALTGKQ